MTVTLDTVRAYLEPRFQELLSRLVRQEFQAFGPTLFVVASGRAGGMGAGSIAVLGGVTALVTFITYFGKLTAGPDATVKLQIAERAVKAATGTALGYLTVDGVNAAAVIPWGTTLTASLASAGIAIGMWFTNPPVVALNTGATDAGTSYRRPVDGDLLS